MKVQWSDDALADLLDAYAFIASDNPVAAERVQARLIGAAERLQDFPNSGRIGRRSGTREMPVSQTPYVMIYVVSDDRVIITRLWHGAREPFA